jgi:hypothetical protein
MLLEGINEVVYVLLSNIFYSEVVDYQSEGDWWGLEFPQPVGVSYWVVAMGCEAFDE